MNELEVLNKHVSDILECRIEATLLEMERTALCEVPENDTMTPKEFLKLTEQTCARAFETLKNQSLKVEASVDELINTLKAQLTWDESLKVGLNEEHYPCKNPEGKHKTRCQECLCCSFYNTLNTFSQRNTESLIKCE